MESLKSIYNNMSDMSKMLIKILVGIILALLAMFLVVLVLRVVRGTKGTDKFEKLENSMVSASEKYYKEHKNKMPDDNDEDVIKLDDLVALEYLKDIETYVGKETKCSGYVTVINNNKNTAFIPYLDCGKKYTTKLLIDEIIKNNKIVEIGNGLYSTDNDEYVFKGEFVDNYLTFAGKNWRILKINEDGTIKLLLAETLKNYINYKWDDRYNVEKKSNVGINNYSLSRIRERLNVIYNDENVFTKENKALITRQTLCVGPRAEDSADFSGEEECSETLENDYLGLLQANEYLDISLDENCETTLDSSCSNYNYIASGFKNLWTMTPSDADSYSVYKISKFLRTSNASSSSNILFTINLTDKAIIEEGNGTLEKPYIIKGEQIEKRS